MELDAREFAEATSLDAEVCVVGGGPAGLVVAAELAEYGRDVVVLESGGHAPEPDVLELNDGDVVGDGYAGLRRTRHRQVGGTANTWNTPVGAAVGAKYAPLDPIDLEPRPPIDHSGWPLSWDALRPYYERAQRICGLGPFEYDAARWSGPGCAPFERIGPQLVSRVYQLGARDALIAPLLRALTKASTARLCTHATAVRLDTDASRRRALGVAVGSPGGPRWRVRAGCVVLAAGAVENARLLLASGDWGAGAGDGSGWVGRCFMEHPRDSALLLVPHSAAVYAQAAFYDARPGEAGTAIVGRLALAADALRSGELLNASATLLPRPRSGLERARAALGPIGRLGAVVRWLPPGGHGWSRHPSPQRVFEGFTILLNLEQTPHPDNRVTLGSRRDALGVPTAELHWRWRPADHERLQRLRALVARELEGAGLGRVVMSADRRPDPNAHHHAGTTRMSTDPRDGVVDPNARLHSMDNVFVTGASVFPTAGFANPVLTIVALALRLADHLKASPADR